jgi:hypothetical protein
MAYRSMSETGSNLCPPLLASGMLWLLRSRSTFYTITFVLQGQLPDLLVATGGTANASIKGRGGRHSILANLPLIPFALWKVCRKAIKCCLAVH